MNSRMNKYYENDDEEIVPVLSRTKRNEELYHDINNSNLDNLNIESNAHVIGDNENNIDINRVKEILEKKYNYEEPKRTKVIEEVPEDIEVLEENENDTKEYNINSLIAKERKNQQDDYNRERLKKIRDTQYDILKNLDLPNNNLKNKNDENLMNLINTINETEATQNLDPLDILSDLKGSENTVVLEGIKEDNQKQDIKDTVKDEIKKEIDKTFYTNSMSFTQSDFDDFNDLKEDVESNKLLVKILLIIVGIVLIIGFVFLANHIFNLGWF